MIKATTVILLAFLLLFSGCIKTTGNGGGTTTVEKTGEQGKPQEVGQAVDLGISESDLQIDDPGIDPAADSSELERP